MAEPLAALFKLGQGAVFRPRCKLTLATRIRQVTLGGEHRHHLPGVVLPVSGQVQGAAVLEPTHQLRHKQRLDQPALVVFLLVPGIGEEYLDGIQRSRRNAVPQDFHRVVAVDPDVIDALLRHAVQQFADTGAMYLDAHELRGRGRRGHGHQRLAHAEADFQYPGADCAEAGIKVEHAGAVLQAPMRPVLVKSALLPGRHTAGAQDIAANGSPGVGVSQGWRDQASIFQLAAARQPQPAINARPPSGVIAPSQRRPLKLSR